MMSSRIGTVRRRFSCGVAAIFVACPALAGSVLYVDDNAGTGGEGTSWGTAYRFLQDALAFAANPAHGILEVRIAQGTYRPDRNQSDPGGSGDRSATFHLISGVSLRGGYAGLGAPDPDARDVDAYPSILSGDLAGDDQPGFYNNSENSYHVTAYTSINGWIGLDGLQVLGGHADSSETDGEQRYCGAGLYVADGSVSVEQCKFRWNAAEGGYSDDGGGAVFVAYGGWNLDFAACLFENNAAVHGGAMRFEAHEATFSDCTFRNNQADAAGAIQGCAGSLKIADCAFVGNVASAGAGGILLCGNAPPSVLSVVRSAFVGNTAALGVGGMGAAAARLDVVSSFFAQNETGYFGGGLLSGGGQLVLANCAFSRNVAGFAGGAYMDSEATVAACTFAGNSADAMVVGSFYGSAAVADVVCWGNQANFGTEPDGTSGPLGVSFSDIQGGWPGTGNIDADPLFVQPGTDDLRLSFGSPCVNAGSNAALPPDELDLDGDGDTNEPIPVDLAGGPRILDGVVDMGAYEGEFAPGAPAANEGDLDQGEFAVLVPAGGPLNPLVNPTVLLTNVSPAATTARRR